MAQRTRGKAGSRRAIQGVPVLGSQHSHTASAIDSLGQRRVEQGGASSQVSTLERPGVTPGLGWTLWKEPPQAFQKCPCSEGSAAEWDLLQRQLPGFQHLTCSRAVSHAQLLHPLLTHPPQNTDCCFQKRPKRAVPWLGHCCFPSCCCVLPPQQVFPSEPFLL